MGRFGSDQERRRRRAAALYRFEMALREEGAISDFVYDEEQDLLGDRGDIPQEPRGPQSAARGGGSSLGWSEPGSPVVLPANAGETEGLPSQRPSGGPLRFLLSPRALPL